MSVICQVAFADRQVTRMTVWGYGNDLDIGRALQLAHYAYESRMRRPPPEKDITIAGKIYRLPHILALRSGFWLVRLRSWCTSSRLRCWG